MDKEQVLDKRELCCSFFSNWFLEVRKLPIPRHIFNVLLNKIISSEGGVFRSYTLRRVLLDFHGIALGSYSYGHIPDIFGFRPKTYIGRYVSIGPGVKVFNANHPDKFLSMHPFFYLSGKQGIAEKEMITRTIIEIGHDVWLGANSIICPGCHQIGISAVVGAGAIVTKDVPDYAIVAGNPAKVIKMRFSPKIIQGLLESKWWEIPISDFADLTEELSVPLVEENIAPLLEKIRVLRGKLVEK